VSAESGNTASIIPGNGNRPGRKTLDRFRSFAGQKVLITSGKGNQ
jgi:hypothetical protein